MWQQELQKNKVLCLYVNFETAEQIGLFSYFYLGGMQNVHLNLETLWSVSQKEHYSERLH